MPGTVYILQSLTNSRYYIGSTNNLTRRLAEHNSHRSKYTKLSAPFKLVFHQEFPTLKQARQIEYKLKQLKSHRIISQIITSGKIKLVDDKINW